MKKDESLKEFSLIVYEKDSNKFSIQLLWIWVIVQMIGFFICIFSKAIQYVSSYIFIMNSGLFSLMALFIRYVNNKYHFAWLLKYIKYAIITMILALSAIISYSYINDVVMQIVWIMPVAMSVLYLNRNLMIFSIAGALTGVFLMEIISPVEKAPGFYVDQMTSSLMLIVVFCFIFYMLSQHIQKITLGINNTLDSVVHGTKTINHSLKNQINTVDIYIENYKDIFQEKGIDPTGLLIIEEATKHLNGVINRIQTSLKNPILDKSTTNLSDILNSCIDLFEARLKRKNVKIYKEYLDEIPLFCDAVLIKEVFSNLILNSIEAFNKNENKLTIQVHKGLKNVRINVIDNGCGIPKEILPRIIDPHFSTKDRNNNFGLGLTHCYKIIQEHNGSFDIIYTEVNKGTNVEIILPLL